MKATRLWAVMLCAVLAAGCSVSPSVSVGQAGSSSTPGGSTVTTRSVRPIAIAEHGFSIYGTGDQAHTSWAAIVENPNEDLAALDVILDVRFWDESGRDLVINTDGRADPAPPETIPVLLPGRTAWSRYQPSNSLAPAVWGKASRMEVRASASKWARAPTGSVAVSGVRLGEHQLQYGTVMTISGTARSTLGEPTGDVVVVGVLRDVDGKLIGGARQPAGSIAPEGSTEVRVEEWERLGRADTAEMSIVLRSLRG